MRLLLASLALVVLLPLAGMPDASAAEASARGDRDYVAPFLPGACAAFPAIRVASTPLGGEPALVVTRDASSVAAPSRDVPGAPPVHDEQARWRLRHSTSSSIP